VVAGNAPGNFGVDLINEATGAILAKYTSPAFANLYVFDVALAADNTFYVLGDQNFFTAEIVHMDLNGNTLGTITSPVSDNSGFLSPEGFGLDPRDGSFWIGLVNSDNILHIDSSGNFLGEFPLGTSVNDVAVGADGLIYYTNIFGASVNTLDPSTGAVSVFANTSGFPANLTWSGTNGDLYVGTVDGGVEVFDQSGNFIQEFFDFGTIAGEPAPDGNVWESTFNNYAALFNPGGSFLFFTSLPTFQPGLARAG